MENKRYCIYCGKEIEANATECPHCHKKVSDKENLFLTYLINHTKEKFKGDVEDKVYEVIKNWLLSHLYGSIVTVLLVTTAVSGIRVLANNNNVPTTDTAPSSTTSITRPDDISSLTRRSNISISNPFI